MANWIARSILAATLIFSSGGMILSVLLGSLAVFFTSEIFRVSAPAHPLDELPS
jgi:hypothetical protein